MKIVIKIPIFDRMAVKYPSPIVNTWLICETSSVSRFINAPEELLSISFCFSLSISLPS